MYNRNYGHLQRYIYIYIYTVYNPSGGKNGLFVSFSGGEKLARNGEIVDPDLYICFGNHFRNERENSLLAICLFDKPEVLGSTLGQRYFFSNVDVSGLLIVRIH